MRSPSSAPPDDSQDRDSLVREAAQAAIQQLVGEAALARPPGTRDSQHRRLPVHLRPAPAQRLDAPGLVDRRLEHGQDLPDPAPIRQVDRSRLEDRSWPRAHPTKNVFGHSLEPQGESLIGVVDLLDAVGFEGGDLLGSDRAAAAHHDPDMLGAGLPEQIHHVAEVLVVPALVGTAGYGVGVFLQRGSDDVCDAPVMPKVYDLGAVRLQQPPHDVDGGIMPVEQRRGRHEPQRRSAGIGGRQAGVVGCGAHGCVGTLSRGASGHARP